MLVGSIVLLPKSKIGRVMNDGQLVQTIDPKHEIYSISNVRCSLTSNDLANIISKIYKVYDIKSIIEGTFPTEDSFDKNSNSSSDDRKHRKRMADERNTFIETVANNISKIKRKKKKSTSPLTLANIDIDDYSETNSLSDLSLNTVVLIDDDLETLSLEGQISDDNWHQKTTAVQHNNYYCPSSTTVKAGIKPNNAAYPCRANASLKLNNFISDPLFYTLYDKPVAHTTALSRIRDRSLSSSYIDHEQYSLLPSDKVRTAQHTCHTQSPPLPPILKELYNNQSYGGRYHHHPIQNFTLNKMSQRKFLKYAKKHRISTDRKMAAEPPCKSLYNDAPSRSLSPSRGSSSATAVNAATPTSHIIQHSQPIYHNSNISSVLYQSPILYERTQINIRKPYHSTHVTPRMRPQQQILQHTNIYHPPPPPLSFHSSSYKYSTNNMRLYSNKNRMQMHAHGQSCTHYPQFINTDDTYIDNKRRYSVSSSNQAPILEQNTVDKQLLNQASPALHFTSSFSANPSPSTYQQQMYPAFEFDRHTLSTNINPQLMVGGIHHKKKYKKKNKYSKTKPMPNIPYSNTPPISALNKNYKTIENVNFYQMQKHFQIPEKNYKNSDCVQHRLRRKSESLSFSAHRKSNTSSHSSSTIKNSNAKKYENMRYQNVGRRKNNYRNQANIILCASGDEVGDHFSLANKRKKSIEKYRKRSKRQHLNTENSKSPAFHQHYISSPTKRKCGHRRHLSKDKKRVQKPLQYIFADGEDANTSESAGSRLRANSTPSHSKSNISQSSSDSEYIYISKEKQNKKQGTTDDLNAQLKDLQLFDIESEVLNKRRSSNISNSITFFSNESTTASLNLSKSMTNVFSLHSCTSDTQGDSSSPLMYKMIENLEKNVTNHARTFDYGMHFLNERTVEHDRLHLEQKRKSFATVESSPTLSYV